MAANMLLQMSKHQPTLQWTDASLRRFLDELNEKVGPKSSARITSWKQKAVVNLLLHTPAKVFTSWQNHYLEYTWERSCMTEALLADRLWRVGHKFKEAKGPWEAIYTVSEQVLLTLQDRLLKDWMKEFPKDKVRDLTLTELAKFRPCRSVPDDPDWADHTVAQFLALASCFYWGWLRPKVMEEFGDVGAAELLKALEEWHPWFVLELQKGISKRDQAGTFDVFSLSDLTGLHTSLKRTAPGVSMECLVDQTTSLLDEWAKFEEKVKVDKEELLTCITAKNENQRAKRLHELAEFSRIGQFGEKMCQTHGKLFFKIADEPDIMLKGPGVVSAFMETIRVAEGVSADIPLLVFWDLNSLPNTGNFNSHWHDRAQCVASILEARPNSTAAVIVCRKSVPCMSRRRFHGAVTLFLEKRGVDCDYDLSFNYKDGQSSMPLVLSGILAFSQKSDSKKNPWSGTRLAKGFISDIPPPRMQDMTAPFDVDNFAFEAVEPRNMSPTQRSNWITAKGDGNLFAKVLDAAVSGLGGEARSKANKPLAVFCGLDPMCDTCPLAVLQYMQAARSGNEIDLRAVVLPVEAARRRSIAGSIETEVFKQWYQKKYIVPGHPFQGSKPFTGAPVEAPTLQVCRLDDKGGLRLQTAPLKAFFQNESVVCKAKMLWDAMEAEADKPNGPKWQPLAPNSGNHECDDLDDTTPTDPPAPLAKTYPTLEACLASQPVGDTPSANANFRILVDKNGEGWAHCVRETSVAKGDLLVSFGSGSRLDEEASNKKVSTNHCSFLCTLQSDADMVAYRRDTVQMLSFYSLHGQIVLEGHQKVELSYHQLSPATGAQALQRLQLDMKRKRYWVCAKPQTDFSGVRWDNIGRLVKTNHIPNETVLLVWELKKDMQGGVAALTFERPFLAFSRAMTFQVGDWFRWA